MKGFSYFQRLSLAARWALPQKEAGELIEDYRDILADLPEEKNPREVFGAPWAFVSGLSGAKSLRRWHIALCFMLFCALFPPISYMVHDFNYADGGVFLNLLICAPLLWVMLEIIWSRAQTPSLLSFLAEIVAVALAGVVFLLNQADLLYWGLFYQLQRFTDFSFLLTPYDESIIGYPLFAGVVALCSLGVRDRIKKPMSKPLLAGMLLVFLAVAGIYGFTIYMWKINIYIVYHFGGAIDILLRAAVLVFMLLAPVSILLTRMYDRRWRVIFILSLVGMLMCFDLIGLIGHFDWNHINIGSPDLEQDARVMLQLYTQYMVAGAVMGLIGLR